MNYHSLSIRHIDYSFSLNYFLYSKSFLIFLVAFLRFFYMKCPNNFFTIKIINNIGPWNSIFNVFYYKSFRPAWRYILRQKYFSFWYSYINLTLNLELKSLLFFIKVNICIIFNTIWFHFHCAMICIVVFIHYII